MSETTEIVYTHPDGRKEVRYRRDLRMALAYALDPYKREGTLL